MHFNLKNNCIKIMFVCCEVTAKTKHADYVCPLNFSSWDFSWGERILGSLIIFECVCNASFLVCRMTANVFMDILYFMPEDGHICSWTLKTLHRGDHMWMVLVCFYKSTWSTLNGPGFVFSDSPPYCTSK